MGAPDPLNYLGDLIGGAMRAERLEKRLAEEQAERQIFTTFDPEKSPRALAKDLPKDLGKLFAAVNSPGLPIERRAKVLEVIMHKSYSLRNHLKGEADKRDDAVRDAILNDPMLFEQLSKGTVRSEIGLGHFPATAALVTMVPLARESDKRLAFEKKLTTWPPETLGRMLHHRENAAAEGQYFEAERGKYLNEVLAIQYGKMSEDGKKAFKEGYKKAHDVVPSLKDVTDPGK